MKKITIGLAVACLAACNSSSDTAKVDSMSTSKDTTATKAAINSPYEIGYSSKFEMGDPKYAEAVLTLWKAWDAGDLTSTKSYFADTVDLHFSNGGSLHASRDSATAMAQAVRNSMASTVSSVDVVTALKSTDKNENWALIWGKEVNTDKKGGKDSSYIHEAWRFDKDGKVNLMYQFKAGAAPPKK